MRQPKVLINGTQVERVTSMSWNVKDKLSSFCCYVEGNFKTIFAISDGTFQSLEGRNEVGDMQYRYYEIMFMGGELQ